MLLVVRTTFIGNGEGVGVGIGVGVGVGVGVSMPVTGKDGVGVGEGLGVAVGSGVGVGEGLGVGVPKPFTVHVGDFGPEHRWNVGIVLDSVIRNGPTPYTFPLSAAYTSAVGASAGSGIPPAAI